MGIRLCRVSDSNMSWYKNAKTFSIADRFVIRAVKELGVLVNKPLTNFKKATAKLDEHFYEKQFHKSAVEAAMMFLQSTEKQSSLN